MEKKLTHTLTESKAITFIVNDLTISLDELIDICNHIVNSGFEGSDRVYFAINMASYNLGSISITKNQVEDLLKK